MSEWIIASGNSAPEFQRNETGREGKFSNDTDRLWEMGLNCEADRFFRRLLKKKKSYQYLGKLAQGSNPLFRLVMELSPKKILDEVKEEVLLRAGRRRHRRIPEDAPRYRVRGHGLG